MVYKKQSVTHKRPLSPQVSFEETKIVQVQVIKLL